MSRATSTSRDWHIFAANDYQDLNGDTVECHHDLPTALEFSRLLNIARPVHYLACEDMPALYRWDDAYLIERMGDRLLSVAITPDGHADAISPHTDGKHYFVEPYTQQMTMEALLDKIKDPQNNEVCYLQSQNGNLFSATSFPPSPENDYQTLSGEDVSELEPLRQDVLKEIPWASEALGRHPDAVNIWIGHNQSVTSIHCDPYENIYTVIRGAKHFILLPPTEGFLLNERLYPRAIYTRPTPEGPLELMPVEKTAVFIQDSEDEDEDEDDPNLISWASTDPTKDIPRARPLKVTVKAGETLYLPAGWWHHVTQSGEGEDGQGICIALNWWYDMEMKGDKWVWLNALRKVSRDQAKLHHTRTELH